MTRKLTTVFVKKEYNRQIKEGYRGNYEYKRWFSTPNSRLGYKMHEASQKYHTKGIKFSTYFEFGVGPGTWTKMFLNSKKKFTLLDISVEMIKQAKTKFGIRKNIKYIVGNILKFNKKNEFDFVFSSRAIKYVPQKGRLFKVIYDSLKNNGTCVIINQSSDTLMQKIYRFFNIRPKETLHQGGITIKELKNIFQKCGFSKIEFYPVEIKIGIPGFVICRDTSYWVWKQFYKKELGWLSTLLSGSYLIKMKK